MKRTKELLTIGLYSFILLSSCLTAKKVDRQVAKQYMDKQESKKRPNELIAISTTLFSNDNRISNSETKTSNMLPLLFYWSWDYKNTCTLNPRIPFNNFSSTVLNYAGKGLNEKIKGQRLELVVEKIPNQFAIDDKAHLIFIGYAFGWDNVSIKAENMDIVVSYTLTKENQAAKKGVISIPNFNDKRNIGMYKSWKKATSEYLEQYDQNITVLSKMVVDKLIKEL